MDQDQQNAGMSSNDAQGSGLDITQLPNTPDSVLFAGIQFPHPPPPAAPIAPIEFTIKVFGRVFLATRFLFGHKIRAMALPITKAGAQVHEAHCFGLGAFREVQQYAFDEGDTSTDTLLKEVTDRSHDPNICAMIRYSVMIIFFGYLSMNGATGVGTGTGRLFPVRFTDPRMHGQEMSILHSQSKNIHDQKNNAMVHVRFFPTNWTNQPPILSHNPPYCSCLYPGINHFLYIANYLWSDIRPGVCRMPEQPAFLLAADYVTDPKHTEGCDQMTPGRTIVPRHVGAFELNPTGLPHFMRNDSGYLKYCLDGTTPSAVNLSQVHMDLLPNAGAVFIRADMFSESEFGVHWI